MPTCFNLNASGNLTKGMGATKLTEKHSDELTPAGEASSQAFGFGLFDGCLFLE